MTTRTPYALGRLIQHDPRSWGFQAARATALHTVQHCLHGPVLDQGQTSSCTGNACAHALNSDPLRRRFTRILREKDALALYSVATTLDEYPGTYPPDDAGSSGLAVAKAAVKAGRATAYRHAFGLQHALEALVLAPVLIGVGWREAMFTPAPDGLLTVAGDTAGGHEVCLTGIDVERRRVTVQNSWGPSWAVGGRAYLTWDDLGTLLADQGDCTVLTR